MEPAHLHDELGWAPRVFRYLPTADLDGLVRRHWVPVWSLPDGATSTQRVLQHPVCLLVVGPDHAALVGPRRGLSTQRLDGSGWTVGVLLRPAAGALLLGHAVAKVVDGQVPLEALPGLDGAALAAEVRRAMAGDPSDEAAHRVATARVEQRLRDLLPLDAEGDLVNRLVAHVDDHPELRRVEELAGHLGVSERTLQRLCARRLGLSPKWLVRRRRLHEAAAVLRGGVPPGALAEVAVALGYSDQAHFTRDFRSVTGLTPGHYAGEPREAGHTTSAYDRPHG